jgi:2-C-methyl-D-erythritol 2,4-cyclodiphosphate synthase
MLRIGIGYDSHKFTDGDKLTIGGVNIPYERSFLAHSDGDILIHAIIDAILGIIRDKDIGELFPNTPEYKGINSLILLERAYLLLKQHNYKIMYIDNIIILEKPKLSPYKIQMIRNISSILRLPETRINIKTKTNEKMGFVGREEGALAISIVLARKKFIFF